MGLFTSTKQLDSLETLLVDQLRDLYDAEQQLTQALPKMAGAAHSPALRAAFQQHLRETEGQVARLERVFQAVGHDAETESCEAMAGLIAEGEEVVNATGDADVKDAALIAAAQRVEHYEIAGYGCARTFAQRLGKADAAALLQTSLDEETATDKRLTQLAEQWVNPKAQQSS